MSGRGGLVLAVDVGGTKIHAAIGRFTSAGFEKSRETRQSTAATGDLGAMLRQFAGEERGEIAAVGVGIAGPVIEGRVRGANLPWEVEDRSLEDALGGAPVVLVNDLVASGYGVAALRPGEVVELHAGAPPRFGNRALVSPGTGLGESTLFWDGSRHRPVPSEAGHADFGARTDDEIELLRFLRDTFGRVSAERVVSGPGLVNVYVWMRTTRRHPGDDAIVASLGDGGAAEAISAKALDGSSRLCEETLRLWVAALLSEAGSVALRGLAVGGVYLGGGIPAKVLPFLRESGALEPFFRKPPQEELLRAVPIRVVLSPETTLRGAAACAQELAGAALRGERAPR